jgi:hypothetical protein
MGLFRPGLGLGAHGAEKRGISGRYCMRQEIFVNLPVRPLTKKGREPASLPFLMIFYHPVVDS